MLINNDDDVDYDESHYDNTVDESDDVE